jgi:hypothetical protein
MVQAVELSKTSLAVSPHWQAGFTAAIPATPAPQFTCSALKALRRSVLSGFFSRWRTMTTGREDQAAWVWDGTSKKALPLQPGAEIIVAITVANP